MKSIKIFGIILSLLTGCFGSNLPRLVIVDTDGGIDDMRAIILMLASPDVRILAITASCGVLSPEKTGEKVMELCHSLGRGDVPIGICSSLRCKPAMYPLPATYPWGTKIPVQDLYFHDGLELIRSLLDSEKGMVSLVCLGSLTMAMRALLTVPDFGARVGEILWSADGAQDTLGFNYAIDTAAVRFVLRQTIPVKIIKQQKNGEGPFFNEDLLHNISTIGNTYATKISDFFKNEQVKKHPFAYRATDEMVALFLRYPSLFSAIVDGNVTAYTPRGSSELRTGCFETLKAMHGDQAR